VAAVVAITAAVAIVASTASELNVAGADPSPANASSAHWLASRIGPDGLIPGVGSRDNSVQAILALAAVGVGETDANRALTGLLADVEGYIRVSGVDQPGRLSRAILAAVTMGRDPLDFGGVNLLTRLGTTKITTGEDAGLYGTPDPYNSVFNQGLALLAIHAAGATDAAGATWLANQQCPDGGWTGYRASPLTTPCTTATDTNSAALAVSGLVAVGVSPPHDALAYFDIAQSADGGWSYSGVDASDPNSTGDVISALIAVGAASDPRFLDRDAPPVAALDSFRFGCTAPADERGAYWYPPFPSTSPRTPDTLATVQAIPAAAGKSMIVDGAATFSAQTTMDPCVGTTTTMTTPTTITPPITSGSGATPAPVPPAVAPGLTKAQVFFVWVWLVRWKQFATFLDYISALPKPGTRRTAVRHSVASKCPIVAGRRTCRR